MQSHPYCESNLPCSVPAHPAVRHLVREHVESIHAAAPSVAASPFERPLGLNDGAIFEPQSYAPDVSHAAQGREAQVQPKLRGPINVIVVLVDFSDVAMASTVPAYFRDLFFSGKKGSVTGYYQEVSGGQISITGDVVGPYKLTQTMAHYANGGNGKDGNAALAGQPSIRTMADAAVDQVKSDTTIDWKKYDNKHRAEGYVDAFIVVHAGRGGEETVPDKDNLWSVKWVLPAERQVGNGNTKVFPFLTIPEDARLGVCAHELGHLLFGWPDLYDIRYKSDGVGHWCLMSGGNWNALPGEPEGTSPAHPSAWCKANQGWVDVVTDEIDNDIVLKGIKSSEAGTTNGNVHKLWSKQFKKDKEYFLVENRSKTGYDAPLPGAGLLIWHVDDDVSDNDDDLNNYHVALKSADGVDKIPIRTGGNAANPFPGTMKNRNFTGTTVPNSNSFAGDSTFVSVKEISDAGESMKMTIGLKA